MITIEGLRGSGALWCVFDPVPLGDGGIPSFASAYLYPTKMDYFPYAPFECQLPPVTAEQISFPVGMSSFGPVVAEVEVGSISSVNDSPGVPHPCKHTTVNGNLLYLGSDTPVVPKFTWNYAPTSTRVLYDAAGFVATPFVGRPAKIGDAYCYNRFGKKVKISTSLDYRALWYDNTYLLNGYAYPIGSSIPSSEHPMRQNEWYYSSGTLDKELGPINSYRFNAMHTSQDVFEEEFVCEMHTNQSYTPKSSVSPYSGLGYTRAFACWRRTHQLIAIQSLASGIFRVLVRTTTDINWGGFDYPNGMKYGTIPTSVSTTWRQILVLEPGLSLGGALPTDLFNKYCWDAASRATALYHASDMTSARSKAVSDVTGLDSNWIENLSQARGANPVFSTLLEGQKAMKNGNLEAARRAIASAYLAYKYAIAPSLSDYRDVRDNAGNVFKSFSKYRYSNERRRGRVLVSTPVLETTADLSYFITLHLQLKDSSFATVWNALEKLGLDPSANNLWDLIPLSFVVDWFVSIGPALDIISAYNNSTLIRDVRSRIETFKAQWPLAESDLLGECLTDFSVSTPLVYSWYDRRIYSGIGSVDPFSGQSNDGLSVSQMAQGLALLSSYR